MKVVVNRDRSTVGVDAEDCRGIDRHRHGSHKRQTDCHFLYVVSDGVADKPVQPTDTGSTFLSILPFWGTENAIADVEKLGT